MNDLGKQVDDIFDKVERNKGKLAFTAVAVWLGCFALGLGVLGIAIWGFVRLVLHFT